MYSKNKDTIIINNNMQNKNNKNSFIPVHVFLIIAAILFFSINSWQLFIFPLLILFIIIVFPIIFVFNSLRIIIGNKSVAVFILSCALYIFYFLSIVFFPSFITIVFFIIFLLIEIATIKIIRKKTFFINICLFYFLILSVSFFLYTMAPHLFKSVFFYLYSILLSIFSFISSLVLALKNIFIPFLPSRIAGLISLTIVYISSLFFYVFLRLLYRRKTLNNNEKLFYKEINNVKQLIEVCWNSGSRRIILFFLFIINIIFSIYLFYLLNIDVAEEALKFSFIVFLLSAIIIFFSIISFAVMSTITREFKKNLKTKIDFITYAPLFFFSVFCNSFILLKFLEKIFSFS